MAEHKDFYTDALKAFDTPMPQPPKEEPAAEVAEPAPQGKEKRKFSPWWLAGLCAVLCFVLLISPDRDPAEAVRGENCAFGIVLERGDHHAIITTNEEKWYVDLSGLDSSAAQSNMVTNFAWVFYNGTPQYTDQRDCSKKITATYWLRWDPLWGDEIRFDLDNNGKNEIWSVREARVIQDTKTETMMNLTAKDDQGNILYNVYLDADCGPNAVFYNVGGKLSLIVSRVGINKKLEICLEKGELAVYQGTQRLPLQMPTQEQIYQTRFIINSGSLSEMKDLSTEEGAELKRRLDGLGWHNWDGTEFNRGGTLSFRCAGEYFVYSFSNDGILSYGDRFAKLDRDLYGILLKLMGWKMPAKQNYYTNLGGFEMVSISFREDGTVSLWGWDPETGERKTYQGRYATFDNTHNLSYYLVLGGDLEQVVVLHARKDYLNYDASSSNQTMFPVGEVAISFDPA